MMGSSLHYGQDVCPTRLLKHQSRVILLYDDTKYTKALGQILPDTLKSYQMFLLFSFFNSAHSLSVVLHEAAVSGPLTLDCHLLLWT